MRHGQERAAVVEQVVAADLVRAVGQTLWDAGRWRWSAAVSPSSRRRPRRRRCRRRTVARRPSITASDRGHGAARRRRSAACRTWALRSRVTFGWAMRGPDGDDLRVGLGVHQARESVAGRAADARAECRVGLVEQDPARCMKGCRPRFAQVVVQLLDAGFVGHRRVAGRGRCWAAPSGPRRGCRGPGRAVRPGCSRARSRGRRPARPGRCRRSAAVHRSHFSRSRYRAAP